MTPCTLTVGEVPVDGFRSITVYNAKGFMEAPAEHGSVTNLTGKKDADGGVTVHFGGDPSKPNHLLIMPGRTYVARLYRPRAAVLGGSRTLPPAQA